MKKVVIISVAITLAFVSTLKGQFTSLELFSGFEKTDFTLLSSYSINTSNTLSVTTLAFFQKFREKENQMFDEVGVQPTLFWKINQTVAIGPSLYYNSFAGFSERLSAQFTLEHSKAVFIVMPTVAYSEKKDASLAEVFAQFQLHTPLSEKIALCFNGQFLTVWDKFKKHSRSFQQLRLGLSYKGHQFGLGSDFDQYGPKPIHKSSFGLYYRSII
ncbi:MAG: hypothetical protein ABNH00_10325 [Dokdonia sp.]